MEHFRENQSLVKIGKSWALYLEIEVFLYL